MEKSKPTPKPWTARAASASDQTLIIESSYKRLATIRFAGERGYNAEDREHVANAQLMAAAPELLEALRALLDQVGPMLAAGPSYKRAAYDMARAAIDKATGEA